MKYLTALLPMLVCLSVSTHAREIDDHNYVVQVARDSLSDLEVMGLSVVCAYSNNSINVAADYLDEILRTMRAQRKFNVSAPAIHELRICVLATVKE